VNIDDQLAQVKSELERVNDQITGKQAELDELKTQKQQLVADRTELQGYLDWKAAQP
jgi:predicted  nucleic acid-binding Zn-ribbon protein